MNLFFIRHGETTGDVEDRYGGDYDDHLSSRGEEQGATLAQELKDRGIEIIYSSPLIRARETADCLAKQIEKPIVVEPDLKERHQYGILTGMKKLEAKEKYPQLVDALRDRLNTIEGAETYQDFSQRITTGFKKIITDSTHQTIAVIWHGGPVRVLFRDILKWGELKEIGDCAWVELEKSGDQLVLKNSHRIVFDFDIRPHSLK